MPKILTHLQHDVIACILAANLALDPDYPSRLYYTREVRNGRFFG
jgi:hypothetical protein